MEMEYPSEVKVSHIRTSSIGISNPCSIFFMETKRQTNLMGGGGSSLPIGMNRDANALPASGHYIVSLLS